MSNTSNFIYGSRVIPGSQSSAHTSPHGNGRIQDAAYHAAPGSVTMTTSSTPVCMKCEVKLLADDIAIYMKLVTRTAQSFLCIDCLGEKLNCGREPIEELIRYYRESGNCVLFR